MKAISNFLKNLIHIEYRSTRVGGRITSKELIVGGYVGRFVIAPILYLFTICFALIIPASVVIAGLFIAWLGWG